jgi:hypothetical protein
MSLHNNLASPEMEELLNSALEWCCAVVDKYLFTYDQKIVASEIEKSKKQVSLYIDIDDYVSIDLI